MAKMHAICYAICCSDAYSHVVKVLTRLCCTIKRAEAGADTLKLMQLAKMQQQKARRLLAYVLLCSLLIVSTVGHQSQNAAWKYNDPHFDTAQYAKIFGQATGNANGNGAGQEQYGPFQYQYVDHQPQCREGGEPVCATNGNNYFYFENNCKLEAHNMQLLFQHGTGEWVRRTKRNRLISMFNAYQSWNPPRWIIACLTVTTSSATPSTNPSVQLPSRDHIRDRA